MEGKRILWIDVLKGILILFVLLSHSSAPNTYMQLFVPFFLTMFFFASGYTFSTKRTFYEFIVGKIKHLLFPLFTMGGIKLVLACLLQHDDFLERVKGLLFQVSGMNDDLWFIGCMFSASILFYIVLKLSDHVDVNKSTVTIFVQSSIIAVLGWYAVIALQAKLPWQLENAMIMTFYMSLGYLYRRYENRIVESIEDNKVILFASGIVYVLMAFLTDGNADIHKGLYSAPFAYIAMSIIAIPLVLVIAKHVSKTRVAGGVSRIGKNTLFLYAFENYVIIVFYEVCNQFCWNNPYILSLLCVVVITVILFPFAEITNKYIPWMVGGRKR